MASTKDRAQTEQTEQTEQIEQNEKEPLTPVELHYFKRALVEVQLRKEALALKQNPGLAVLSDPHDPTSPFLNYMFQHFIVEFPLLKKNDTDSFWAKIEMFLGEISKLGINTYTPKHTGASQRKRLLYKLQKMIAITLCASIKTVHGNQALGEGSLVSKEASKEASKDITQSLHESMSNVPSKDPSNETSTLNDLKINIITVRPMSEKRTLREVVHAEFIIETHVKDKKVWVAKRHGQFRQLYQQLKVTYPNAHVPHVPSKTSDTSKTDLYREKDRVLLRGFLRRVASEPDLAESTLVAEFLQKNPIQLTSSELLEAERRHAIDHRREEEEQQFRAHVDQKVADLNGLLALLKQQIVQPGGLLSILDVIKKTDTLEALPEVLGKAFEWGRINFAFALHTQCVTSDRATENIAALKRIHSLLPYRAMAHLLKHSNPLTIVKGLLDLFLAQPFGGRSLFQRMMASNINEEAKEVDKEIAALEKEIDAPALCQKIKNAVNTPTDMEMKETRPLQSIIAVLQNNAIEPLLSSEDMQWINRTYTHKDVRHRVRQMYALWVLYARRKEQDLVTLLVFQGTTGELMRELFAIFYQPLAQVYKAANIGESMQHMSAFIDDLLHGVDTAHELNVAHTMPLFLQLVKRHEQHFYQFVHNVHANDTSHLFDDILGYVDHLFGFIARGMPGTLDLLAVIEAAQLSQEEQTLLRQEIQQVGEYYTCRQQMHHERTRQKVMEGEESENPFDFLPNQKDMASVMNDFAELHYDSDAEEDAEEDASFISSASSSASSASLLGKKKRENTTGPQHEATLRMPTLTVIPLITPVFVQHVVDLM
ncbi:hypothetical protein BDF14DRAFT_1730026 [Spinellus fusiger]|nr:hypothetical protein BDF14DRAFT_1730026 [Spinellus fusiger]